MSKSEIRQEYRQIDEPDPYTKIIHIHRIIFEMGKERHEEETKIIQKGVVLSKCVNLNTGKIHCFVEYDDGFGNRIKRPLA